jgi:hypothetical protein
VAADQPGRPVGNDEFDGLRLVFFEIGLEEGHLFGGEIVGAAVVEHGEVRRAEIEAVVRRMAGVFFE